MSNYDLVLARAPSQGEFEGTDEGEERNEIKHKAVKMANGGLRTGTFSGVEIKLNNRSMYVLVTEDYFNENNIRSITTLSCSSNNLSTLPCQIETMSSLVSLNLDNNRF
jgi:Leucine-rich repeat (LRR) protein